MAIYQLDDDAPRIADTAWVADSAQVIGRVELGEGASVWFGAVLRGDNEWITHRPRQQRAGRQRAAHRHGLPARRSGEDVTIGHQVMLHGCTIGDGSLIGIQAVVLNGAKIGRNCLVGAGALVTEGKEFPDGSLIVGSPAKVVRAAHARADRAPAARRARTTSRTPQRYRARPEEDRADVASCTSSSSKACRCAACWCA